MPSPHVGRQRPDDELGQVVEDARGPPRPPLRWTRSCRPSASCRRPRLATSVPAMPIATPMSAGCSAGASLTPSPVMATTCPRACSACDQPQLLLGRDAGEDGGPLGRLDRGPRRRHALELRPVTRDRLGARALVTGEPELPGDGGGGAGVVAGDHLDPDAGPRGRPRPRAPPRAAAGRSSPAAREGRGRRPRRRGRERAAAGGIALRAQRQHAQALRRPFPPRAVRAPRPGRAGPPRRRAPSWATQRGRSALERALDVGHRRPAVRRPVQRRHVLVARDSKGMASSRGSSARSPGASSPALRARPPAGRPRSGRRAPSQRPSRSLERGVVAQQAGPQALAQRRVGVRRGAPPRQRSSPAGA